jgi:phosphoglycerate-specific signal transduction histidine kinase
MRVNDLHLIIRELRQIAVLQETIITIVGSDEELTEQRRQLLEASERLRELLVNYERYDI